MPTIPTWLIAILAVAAIACMVVSYIKKDNPKLKPLAVVAVIILIVCSYAFIDNTIGIGRDNLETRTQQESAKRFNEAKIKKVAEYIKSKNPGKIVIIPQGGSEWAKNEYSKAQAELVKKYVGDAEIKPIEYTRKPEEAPAEPGPTVEEYNKFFKANADAKLFILLEALPMGAEVTKLEVFKSDKQKVALLDMGDIETLKPYFKSELILVAVGGTQGLKEADYQKPAPEDLNAAFDARYELVTKDNIDKIK